MELSIVIVNYNVRYFLDQCLRSVENAIQHLNAEVFVVDNASMDGSVEMIRTKFPWVKLIASDKNLGFSAGNNLAIRKATGKYILLLNPDTVIEENTLVKVTGFMERTPDAGGLGVKMIDGNGKFLPESKRGLPTPWVAFYKIFGLSSLFPKSKKFGKYHLSYLDRENNHKVDVLSGAFMMLRKKTLDEIGLLDETFFMYGEDIDLSYRVTKANYNNYYFAETTIIHYKGESTKKNSINYVFVFYNAMLIFAKKHFSNKYALIYSFLIRLAVILTASMAALKRIVKKIFQPVIDAALLFAGFAWIAPAWEQIRYNTNNWLPDYYLYRIVPIYITVWIISLIYSGSYDKPIKQTNTLKGIGWGTLLLLVTYALLPESLRFSRMVLLFGALWATGTLPLIRWVYFNLLKHKNKKPAVTNSLLIGNKEEIEQIEPILKGKRKHYKITGHVRTDDQEDAKALGHVTDIDDIVRIHHINEIIFSSNSLTAGHIIRLMAKLSEPGMAFKIASPDGVSVIGSSSIDAVGDLYSVKVNAISTTKNLRFKRTVDFLLAFLFLILTPILVFTVKRKVKFLKNAFFVLIGKISWVGFAPTNQLHELPIIKKGVLNPSMLHKNKRLSHEIIQRLNVMYAKDYNILTDFTIVLRLWKHLGS